VNFVEALGAAPAILTEGSIYERLRRNSTVQFDPELAHAALIYDDAARAALEATHRDYIDIGVRAGLPFAALTDTWRANAERIAQSRWRGSDVNGDNVRFLDAIRRSYLPTAPPVFVGALTGCRGDAYRPEEALASELARAFHAPQIDALAAAAPDFLMAATLPAFSEAAGIARAMEATAVPYILSFVLLPDGRLLDGTPFGDAIAAIDDASSRRPAGYAVNCVHPSVFAAAAGHLPERALARIVAFQGNTSRLPPWELDGREELDTEDAAHFAAETDTARLRGGARMVGGCCGTDARHVAAIAELLPRS
jgi:homocysteine S-methyltransferase